MWRRLRWVVVAGASLLLLLLAVMAAGAARLAPPDMGAAVPPAPAVAVDPAAAAARLGAAIRIPTLAVESREVDLEAFTALHRLLAESFPRLHAAAPPETIGSASRLHSWSGSDRSLRPLVLLAHQDVVPVEPGTEADWEQPPFSGAVAGGFVWGRGAIDDKGSLLAILEACEALLAEGFAPRRTVFLAFGHDEETGGVDGAAAIAAELARRGVEPEMVLDEGMMVLEGIVPGTASPVAMVGIAEKGILTLEVSAEMPGAHSSLPPRETAIGLLAAGLARLGERRPPVHFEGAPRRMLEALAAQGGRAQRAVVGNLWLTRPLVVRRLAGSPAGNALLRTTVAPTIVAAGIKENVIPGQARAVVNLRIHPGDTLEGAQRWVEEALGDRRLRVDARSGFATGPSPVSTVDGEAYGSLAGAIRAVFPDALVAPGLVIAATDSRYYTALTDRVYRFIPYRLGSDDVTRPHGTGERVTVAGHAEAIRFYAALLRQVAGEAA